MPSQYQYSHSGLSLGDRRYFIYVSESEKAIIFLSLLRRFRKERFNGLWSRRAAYLWLVTIAGPNLIRQISWSRLSQYGSTLYESYGLTLSSIFGVGNHEPNGRLPAVVAQRSTVHCNRRRIIRGGLFQRNSWCFRLVPGIVLWPWSCEFFMSLRAS